MREPNILEFELLSTDANALEVLEGAEDISVSEDDGKVNAGWLNGDEVPKELIWLANGELLELFVEAGRGVAGLMKLLVAEGNVTVEVTVDRNDGEAVVPFD